MACHSALAFCAAPHKQHFINDKHSLPSREYSCELELRSTCDVSVLVTNEPAIMFSSWTSRDLGRINCRFPSIPNLARFSSTSQHNVKIVGQVSLYCAY